MFDPENPPELDVTGWINAREALTLARLKGRVVVVVAFQMLCPACVEHALPQAKRLAARFNPEQVAVIGLHTVFEHHKVMTPEALEVFVHEYRLPFPVGIDTPVGDGPPRTFAAYQMQGTPTLLLFDREGRLRRHYFGRPDDITLAAEIMAMAIEDKGAPRAVAALSERKIGATLLGEQHEHDHDHAHHDHAHHDHEHGDGCGCGHDHHDHDHGHKHAHGHGHSHAAAHRHDAMATGGSAATQSDLEARLAGSARMTEPPKDAGKR